MVDVFDVANYFLAIVNNNDEYGDIISNLKLQKLCYYAQGLYLAINKQSLFEDDFEAWQHGPVIPNLYHKYKRKKCLSIDKDYDINVLPISIRKFLDTVYEVYGQFSAWKLREMTHQEAPWKSVYNDNEKHILISKDSMQNFFLTRVE